MDSIHGAYGFADSADGAVTVSAGLTVAIAAITAGAYRINGIPVNTAYAASTVTLRTADADNPRLDLIYVDSSGAVGVVRGTPAAVPFPPSLGPATRMHLAQVRVLAATGVLVAADITDMRLRLAPAWEHIDTQILTAQVPSVAFTGLSAAYFAFHLVAHVLKDAQNGHVYLRLNADNGANYNDVIEGTVAAGTTDSAARTAQAQWQLTGAQLIASEQAGFEAVIAKPVATKEALSWARGMFTTVADGPSQHCLGGQWNNLVDRISRIDVLASAGNFDIDSRFSLFGLRVQT